MKCGSPFRLGRVSGSFGNSLGRRSSRGIRSKCPCRKVLLLAHPTPKYETRTRLLEKDRRLRSFLLQRAASCHSPRRSHAQACTAKLLLGSYGARAICEALPKMSSAKRRAVASDVEIPSPS